MILRDLKMLNCDVVVVSKAEKSRKNAIDGGAIEIFNSIEEVTNIDGVVVAVNTIYHYQEIINVLQSQGNIPIFCEKPLCVNSSEAYELFKKAPDNLFVMDKWRYHRGILELARLAKEGTMGTLKGIKLIRNGWGNPHNDVDCTWHLLPHDLSIVLEILGYIPEPKFAMFDQTKFGIQGMSGWMADEKYWVSFEVSERYPGHKRNTVVYFDEGFAQLTDAYHDSIEIFFTSNAHLGKKPVPEILSYKNDLPLYMELKTFTNFIKDGNKTAPKSSAYEGYTIVKTIEKLREIAKIST
ncbi:MAG: Gfo/Idh/MocA family oxidoreductase [Bacteroidetes bacterium]|nr:Gfo/Idh/MocA family oxidoreductase [Bacteroidota bacterium]